MATDTSVRDQHPLTLKVMRLYKPEMSNPIPSLEQCMLPEASRVSEGMLLLPDGFNKIFTGQTFTSFICVVNNTTSPVHNVVMQAELQFGQQRIGLGDIRRGEQNSTVGTPVVPQSCQPGIALEHVIQCEIFEAGVHTLRVVVEYDHPQAQERRSFRKFYRFNVDLPFEIKTSVIPMRVAKQANNSAPTLAVQVTCRNLTSGSVSISKPFLRNVKGFEQNQSYDEQNICIEANSEHTMSILLYTTSNQLDASFSSENNNSLLGNLEFSWKNGNGELGYVRNIAVARDGNIKPELVSLDLELIPVSAGETDNKICVGQQFSLLCHIQNFAPTVLVANLHVDPHILKASGFRVVGLSSIHIDSLAPGSSVTKSLQVVVTMYGLCELDGVHLVDESSGTVVKPTKPYPSLLVHN